MALRDFLFSQRIIPAARSSEDLHAILKLPKIQVLVLLFGDINSLPATLALIKQTGKKAIIHLDLMDGIAKDRAGVSFLAKLHPYGIITTKAQIVKSAKEEGLIAIQRLFAVDSESIRTGIQSIRNCKPDAVEVLPGIIPAEVIAEVQAALRIPVIAGGLLRNKTDIAEALARGAVAVTTSCRHLL